MTFPKDDIHEYRRRNEKDQRSIRLALWFLFATFAAGIVVGALLEALIILARG